MFTRVSAAIVALALAIPMIAASPAPLAARSDRDSCNSADVYCCNTAKANNGESLVTSIFGFVPVVATAGKLIGAHCSPLQVATISGNSCTQQTACCSNNNFNGVINIECNPINLGA